MRILAAPLPVLLAASLTIGCGASTSSPAQACVPGVTQSCLCVGGGSGVQSCKDDGSGFSACVCAGGDSGVDSSPDGSALDSTTPLDSALADTPADSFDAGGDTVETGDASTPVIFSEAFTGGAAPTIQCGRWEAFRKSLSASRVYSKITIKGSLSATGISCAEPGISGPKADMICQALRTGTSIGVPCNSDDSWTVGLGCGGAGVVSLVVNTGGCSCEPGYVVRPCTSTGNWGGVGTTCSAASQTLTVICE